MSTTTTSSTISNPANPIIVPNNKVPYDVQIRPQCSLGINCMKKTDDHFQSTLHPEEHPSQQNSFSEIQNNYTKEKWNLLKKDENCFGGSLLWQNLFDEAKRLNRPLFICAPMHDASELAFRLFTKKYGCDLGYTPMVHAVNFAKYKFPRAEEFHSCEEDRPFVLQFCVDGNDPQSLLASAKYVEYQCDAVDINFGCPQTVAKRGNYGAFLMEKPDQAERLVRTVSTHLKIPLFVKIRVFESIEETVALARRLESAGASLICVHGRTRFQIKNKIGDCSWDHIKAVVDAVKIPVIGNGGIKSRQQAIEMANYTGCVGVMSGHPLLLEPTLFNEESTENMLRSDMAIEYCELANKHWALPKHVRYHVFKILTPLLEAHKQLHSFRPLIAKSDVYLNDTNQLIEIVKQIREIELKIKSESQK